MAAPEDLEFRMHLRFWAGAALIFLVLLPEIVSSQEILERESGLFATTELSASIDATPRNRLVIRSADALGGSLTIRSADQPGVTVTYVKLSRTTDRSRAYDFIDIISLSLSVLADHARLVMRAPNPAPWKGEREAGLVEAVVTVPYNCAIEIEATQFDVEAFGPLSAVIVSESLGRLSVSEVHGRVELTTANRRIFLQNVSGRIEIATTNAEIVGRNIRASDVAARFRNEGGDIRITDLIGGVNVRNKFGKIDIFGFRPMGEGNVIRGNSAPIRVDIVAMTEGQLIVSNRYEDIEISVPRSLDAFYSLSVDGDSKIETLSLPLRAELVQKNRLNLISGEGLVSIRGSIHGRGNILLTGVERVEEAKEEKEKVEKK